MLEGLGIPTEVHRQPLSTLSGGFKLRVLLAQVLAADPDVLLLDEPTNHLDILSIRWLEKFLAESYKGTAIVISHDHRFLDNVCTHIVDVDYETIMLYPGNYTAFMDAKVGNRDRKEAEIEKREAEIARHKEFVDRFKAKATKARQAQSKVKMIEKIVIERLPQTSRRYPTFKFKQGRPSGRKVLEVEGISKSYGEKQVLKDVSLTDRARRPPRHHRPERHRQVHPAQDRHGRGRGRRRHARPGATRPTPATSRRTTTRCRRGASRRVEAWLWESVPGEPIGFVRGNLGLVLFSGDDVKKPVGSLSGGEAARLVFCKLSVTRPNVLVLDEPTNHLDLEAIEALVEGLREYDGTLIFVSHDRWFVSQLADRILEISPARDQRLHAAPTRSTWSAWATTTSTPTPSLRHAPRAEEEGCGSRGAQAARPPRRSGSASRSRSSSRSASTRSPPRSNRPRAASTPSTSCSAIPPSSTAPPASR